MGVSHTAMKCETSKLEVAVDVERDSEGELTYTLSMGTGFTGCKQASVNIETPPLSRAEYVVLLGQLNEALKLEPDE